jgi:hypothetical protein
MQASESHREVAFSLVQGVVELERRGRTKDGVKK